MPKYFNGDRDLLFPIARIESADLSSTSLSELFAEGNELSVCVSFSGFNESCLGYVAHIRKAGNMFELLNICSELELRVEGFEALALVLAHVCGASYSPEVQAVFQQIRNDIGSAQHVPVFSG